jgi:hypothetical protein
LRGPIREEVGWYNLTWTNRPEPNDGVWTWDDIAKIRLRFTRDDPAPVADTDGMMRIVEVWITVHYIVPTVYIDPLVANPTTPFSVAIKVGNVDELYGWEFKLSYNTTVLTATSVTVGPFLNNTYPTSTWGYVVKRDDTAGLVWVTQTVLYDNDGVPRGSGTLATISFTIDSPGGAASLQLYDTKLAGYDTTTKKTFEISHYVPRDVATTNVVPSRNEVFEGESMTLTVTVKNKGYRTETFTVTTYANESIVGSKSVTLSAGATTSVPFTWTPIGYKAGSYLMGAISSGVSEEIYITDNAFYDGSVAVYLFGDVNNDGIVDVRDLAALGKAYGTTASSPGWNPKADLNGDNSIGIVDLSLLSRNYGKPAP